MKTTEQLSLESKMSYCYGTERYYKSNMLPFVYTDGVKTFVENAGGGSFWFLTECLAFINGLADFSSIVLKVKGGKADIVVNGEIKKHIAFTDCPDGDWEFFYEPDGKVLLWNGEY